MKVLSLPVIGFAGASALVSAPLGRAGQKPLADDIAGSRFNCDLPPALDPSGDGLPSSESLFSSHDALLKQVERHQAIVRVPSVCYDDLGDFDEDERWELFYKLHDVLAETYPVIHERADLVKVNTFGLVYTVEGSDPALKPVLLAAHQDVVPVDGVDEWTYGPFEGHFDGEWLWGRGASDDKSCLTAIMSALETLLADPEWAPRRTLLLAFGFDEECSGGRGAGSIAEVLMGAYGENGIGVIIDEGGLGMQQIGDTLYALPAVHEKSYLDVWFELSVVGGHSSIPVPHTGIGIMSEIVTVLEANPFSPELLKGSPVYNHLVCQARYSPEANPRLRDLLRRDDMSGLANELIRSDPTARYLIQTSQAVDVILGGTKINAMPETVTLGVNYRVAPQDTVEMVQHRLAKQVQKAARRHNLQFSPFPDDDEYAAYLSSISSDDSSTPESKAAYSGTLTLRAGTKSKPTPVAPTSGPVWDVFSGSIQHSLAFKGGRVVPVGEIMTGNTDTRHYLGLSPNIYRWTPSRERGHENIHAVDERVRMESHMEVVRFYYDLIRNFDSADV